MMNDWHDGGWGAGRWIAMGLMMLAFWGLLAALAVYLIRTTTHRPADSSGPTGTSPDQAMRILAERFARGEIDADEYSARRDVLRSS
jgi:putative membrane protein